MLIKGDQADNIVLGDTFTKDGFDRDLENNRFTFDYALANPPFGVEWKQQKSFIEKERSTLGYDGRFGAGLPRVNDGALLFLQHMLSKMRAPADGGSRIAIVFNGSPLFTGDAGSGESEIRRWIIEQDWLEAIVALPEQLFYNTGISTYVWVLTNRKQKHRKGRIQLIDARNYWVPMKKSLGQKRRKLGDQDEGEPDQIGEITRIHGNFIDGDTREFTLNDKKGAALLPAPAAGRGAALLPSPAAGRGVGGEGLVVSKVFDNDDFGFRKITVERPLRLNFQASDDRIARLDDESAFQKLATSNKKSEAQRLAEIEAGRKRQAVIKSFLKKLQAATGGAPVKDRRVFLTKLKALDRTEGVRLSAGELKAVLAALSERDETAEICRDAKGNPEPDAELRDTETVPLKEDVNEYFQREVLPHVPDAWIDHSKTKIGYEIPLNRHFYRYEPPRPLEEIERDIQTLEKEIMTLLAEVTA